MLWQRPNKTPEKGFFFQHLLHGLEQEGCFLCATVIAAEHSFNSLFYEGIMDEGICDNVIPANGFGNWRAIYILSVDEFYEHTNLSRLLEIERKKFAALQMEPAEFDRKRSYEFAKEPKGAEQTSWQRVVELSVGKRGIFPRQGK